MAEAPEVVEAELDATEEEIREALKAALGYEREDDPRPEGVYTTAELAEMFGASLTQMRGRIRRALKDGAMERLRFYRIDSMGRKQPVNGYRLVGENGHHSSD